MVMLALAPGLLLVGFWLAVIGGQNTEIERLDSKLAGIRKEIRDNTAHAKKLGKLKEKIAKLDAELLVASQMLPTEKEIPNLLEQISNLGTQFGLAFDTFQPRAEILKDHYAEVPVQIKVTGKFHNTLMFFDAISQLQRIVAIKNISMKQDAKIESGHIEMSCLAVTFRYIEPSKRKKPETEGKKAGKKAGKRR